MLTLGGAAVIFMGGAALAWMACCWSLRDEQDRMDRWNEMLAQQASDARQERDEAIAESKQIDSYCSTLLDDLVFYEKERRVRQNIDSSPTFLPIGTPFRVENIRFN